MMMMRLTTARVWFVFSATIDEVCWICLDGDTEGREVRAKTRAFASRVDVGDVASNRDDAMMPRFIARRDGTTENAREPPNLREDAFEIF